MQVLVYFYLQYMMQATETFICDNRLKICIKLIQWLKVNRTAKMRQTSSRRGESLWINFHCHLPVSRCTCLFWPNNSNITSSSLGIWKCDNQTWAEGISSNITAFQTNYQHNSSDKKSHASTLLWYNIILYHPSRMSVMQYFNNSLAIFTLLQWHYI